MLSYLHQNNIKQIVHRFRRSSWRVFSAWHARHRVWRPVSSASLYNNVHDENNNMKIDHEINDENNDESTMIIIIIMINEAIKT